MALKSGILVKDGKQMGYPQNGSSYTAGDYIVIDNDEIRVNPVVPDHSGENLVLKAQMDAALEEKQNVFTSGDYLEMANGVLNVTKNKGNDLYSYKFITTSTSDQPRVKIQRYINGVFQSEETYNNDNVRVNPVTLDGLFTFTYGLDGYRWQYTLLANSNQHNAGEVVKWMYNVSVDSTESFDVVPQDTSKNLVLQEDLDAALATKANASDVTTALATKQDATDNNLTTTSKTVVGAVNELKSGLTDLSEEVNGDATTYPYADVITIEDAVPANVADCNVKIEPVQDLHGQSAPYVGGAGKNKLPLVLADIKAANTDGSWSGNTYTINNVGIEVLTDADGNVTGIKANGTASQLIEFKLCSPTVFGGNEMILNGCPAGGSAAAFSIQMYNATTSEYLGYDTGSGYTYTYTDGNEYFAEIVVRKYAILENIPFYPMIRLATETDATFAPYTNYCPITGHTEASVQRDGVNLFPDTMTWELGAYGNAGNKISADDRVRTVSGVTVRPNTQYTVSFASQHSLARICKYDSDGVFLGVVYSTTFTTDTNCRYISITVGTTNTNVLCQLELGSTATPYEPYAGKTYTIALGDTIYGGTVDFNTGKVRVDRILRNIVWGVGYSNDTLLGDYRRRVWQMTDAGDGSKASQSMCDVATYLENYTSDTLHYYLGSTTILVFLPKDTDNDFSFNIVYYLATPTTIQLTPQQIQLLQGQNTLTASTGDISVTVNGVSGAIGSVQEQVNGLAEEVAEIKPVDYSTTEQKTGQKWIDGKDIYLRVWDFVENVNVTSGNYYTNFNIDSSNMDKVLLGAIINDDGTLYGGVDFDPTRETHTLLGVRPNNNCNVRFLILQYTKTT